MKFLFPFFNYYYNFLLISLKDEKVFIENYEMMKCNDESIIDAYLSYRWRRALTTRYCMYNLWAIPFYAPRYNEIQQDTTRYNEYLFQL